MLLKNHFWTKSSAQKSVNQPLLKARKAWQSSPIRKHDSTTQIVWEAVIADMTKAEEDSSVIPSRLHVSTWRKFDRMDLVAAHAVQDIECIKSVPYLYDFFIYDRWVLCLGQAADKLRQSLPWLVQHSLQPGDYRQYNNAGACRILIYSREWRRGVCVCEDLFSRWLYRGAESCLQ